MIEITADTAQAARTVRALRRLPAALRRDIAQSLRASALEVARTTRQLLRRGRGPSAPGEPPARRSGTLARSIRTKRGRGGLSYSVLALPHPTRGPVALFLEAGTTSGGKRVTLRTRDKRGTLSRRSARQGGSQRTAPRPFLTLALDRHRDAIANRVGAAIGAALERAGRESGR